jgi:hypothetical protein
MPRTITTEVTTAVIRIITTLGTVTVAIATRVTRPTGVQGSEDHWCPFIVD